MRKIVSLLSVLMLLCALAYGQTRNVSGTVRDDNGNPIPFATISEVGANNATKADATGGFSIKIKEGSQITITATGFTPRTITPAAGNQAVTLAVNPQVIQEVVVTTALGQQRQAKELGYSTAKVKATELTQSRPVNLQNGLTGKVSGLNVQTVNNSVFGDTRITLRGIRSLTGNNQPMLIVDGVPMALRFVNSLNPNDVQDVTLLKSATATAVYGPEGVNGAIVITTRKGSRNRPMISVSHTIQAERVSFMPKFQEGFGGGSAVDVNQQGIYDPIENQGYGDAFDGSLRQIGRKFDMNGDGILDSIAVTYEARPDEKRKFWETGFTNQTDVSFSTGDFYLSAQNVKVTGVMPKDENNRISVRMSANKEYNKFRATFNTNYTQQNYDINAGSQFGNGRDYAPYWNVINTPMQIPITQFKNWRTDFWSNPNYYFNDYYHNPYWLIDMFREEGRTDDILGNLDLNFKATSWLGFTYRLGGTVTNSTFKQFQYPFTYNQVSKASGKSNAQSGDIAAGVRDGSSFSYRLNQEFYASAGKTFNKIRIDGLLGHNFREEYVKNINISSLTLGIPGLFNVSARKGEPAASEGTSKVRLQRFFGRANFAFNNWAFAEFAGSYDYDSRLANPYNYNVDDINFFYSSASASLVLSEAIASVKNSKSISYLKVRGSVGKSGNVGALGAYSLENRFVPGPNFPYGNTLGYSANDVLFQSSYQPEFVKTVEAGFEIGFLRNRINFEATAYKQDNSNQLITVDYSAATGYPKSLLNAASFTNKGIELDLRLTPLVKLGDVSIDFKVNYTLQDNEVTKLLEGVDELSVGNANYVIKNYPAYVFKLTSYQKDSLGRVIVDKATGFPTVTTGTEIFGRTIPKHLLGLNLNVNWKGLTFAAVADYRTGNYIYSGIGPDMDFSGISYRTGQNGRMPFIFPNSVYNTNPDPNGKPTYVENTTVYTPGGYSFWSTAVNTGAQSNYLASAAFWKLREVSLGYSLPMNWFGFTKGAVKSATFTLTGRNLLMWLPETNEWTDPEFSNSTGNGQGVNDRNNNPPTRIFGANLTVNF
jgi:TonB-linked SusC/RagA family outer membrane protein